MKTSTSAPLKGWRNTYAPKCENINVREWLKENGLQNDAPTIRPRATFRNFRNCLDQGGRVDFRLLKRYTLRDMDTFLRDAIYSALEAIEPDRPFFTPGTRYRCIREVRFYRPGYVAFHEGKIYAQYCESSTQFGWLTNDQGNRHTWPQPAQIAELCRGHNIRPENADPRLYFEPVGE